MWKTKLYNFSFSSNYLYDNETVCSIKGHNFYNDSIIVVLGMVYTETSPVDVG